MIAAAAQTPAMASPTQHKLIPQFVPHIGAGAQGSGFLHTLPVPWGGTGGGAPAGGGGTAPAGGGGAITWLGQVGQFGDVSCPG